MIYVDSDNALGSRSGDIDDAWALAALLGSGRPVSAIGSVFGNTTGTEAHRNNQALARLCRFSGLCVAGANRAGEQSEASRLLAAGPNLAHAIALGPLTNFAAALRENPGALDRVGELVCLGANRASQGRWPPYWPFEFNLTHDRQATIDVFASPVPITVIPLDQARRLRLGASDLDSLHGEVGSHLREGSLRWLRRAKWLKLSSTVPIWDLVATAWVIDPSLFEYREMPVRVHSNAWIQFEAGDRRIKVVTGFDPASVWSKWKAIAEGLGHTRD